MIQAQRTSFSPPFRNWSYTHRWLLPRIHFPLPSVQPSPVEMEHVSTTRDIAKTRPLENGTHLVDIVSQGPLEAEAPYLVDDR